MRRAFFLVVVPIGIAAAAEAGIVTVTPDASTYAVGQTITLVVVGDPQGGSANAIYGRLLYSSALTDSSGIAPTQNTHTFASGDPPVVRTLRQNEDYGPSGFGFSEAFDQLFGFDPRAPQENTSSVIKLIAAAEGTLDFFWEEPADGLGNHLIYFGTTPPDPAATVTIVPEPGATVPLALALLGLLSSPRRRRSR